MTQAGGDPIVMIQEIAEAALKDSGAPFERLAEIAALSAANRERLFAELKTVEFYGLTALKTRLRQLDRAKAREKAAANAPPDLSAFALELVDKWIVDPNGATYAEVTDEIGRRVLGLAGAAFSDWLRTAYYERTGETPANNSVSAALALLNAIARRDGERARVWRRVGQHGGKFYLDLCNDAREVVEIDAEGWRVRSDAPVRFATMNVDGDSELPHPERGGSVQALRPLINVATEADFRLAVGWALGAMHPTLAAYPILMINGPGGSGKSSMVKMLRSLFDPSAAPLRALPEKEDDAFVLAMHNHVLALDNLSSLSGKSSDILCRMATGGAVSKRKLHTDTDLVTIQVRRPIAINGIPDLMGRDDLASRSIAITLSKPAERQFEKDMNAELARVRPAVLGALLDAMAAGLRNIERVALESNAPRMADFAAWLVACEPALWRSGEFMAAFGDSQGAALEAVAEGCSFTSACVEYMERRGGDWEATPAVMLETLETEPNLSAYRNAVDYPKSAVALGKRFNRFTETFRVRGLMIERSKRNGRNMFRIAYLLETDDPPPGATVYLRAA